MNTIVLRLKKDYYKEYLLHIFDTNQNDIVLTRTNEVGKYLYSRIRESDLPIKSIIDNKTVKLKIPDINSITFSNKFIYYSQSDMLLINDFIQVHFNMYFHRIMLEADRMGYEKKDALEAFLFGLGLNKYETLYETLKKREYRNECILYTKLYEKLRQKDYRYRAKTFVFIKKSLQMVEN